MTLFRLAVFLASAVAGLAQPVVVATNTILHDLVQQIGGPDVVARCLLPPGMDPHAYEPKPADVRLVAKADLVVVNGLGFETWLAKLVQNSGFRGPVVVASTGIAPLDFEEATHDPDHAHAHGDDERTAWDPHAWHDLRNVVRYTENIRDALVQCAPAHAEAYRQRTAAYIRELEALHAYATAQFATVPPERRKLLTSHDSLRYLGHAYGFALIPVTGLSPDQEPNARTLARLVRTIRKQRVPAVFLESTSNPKVVQLIASEAGVNVATTLYTDSLGEPDSPGGTFLGMFRANVDAIVKALR